MIEVATVSDIQFATRAAELIVNAGTRIVSYFEQRSSGVLSLHPNQRSSGFRDARIFSTSKTLEALCESNTW